MGAAQARNSSARSDSPCEERYHGQKPRQLKSSYGSSCGFSDYCAVPSAAKILSLSPVIATIA